VVNVSLRIVRGSVKVVKKVHEVSREKTWDST
jgi:hypothetical protein